MADKEYFVFKAPYLYSVEELNGWTDDELIELIMELQSEYNQRTLQVMRILKDQDKDKKGKK